MSEDKVKKLGINPIAKIISHISYSHEPEWFTTAPVEAIKLVLKKSGLSLNQIGLWEINVAFSCVTMAAIDDLGIDENKVNINGGSVALGHPIGASGSENFNNFNKCIDNEKRKVWFSKFVYWRWRSICNDYRKLRFSLNYPQNKN